MFDDKVFGKEYLIQWMEREKYTSNDFCSMVTHGDRVTAILTKDNKVHHFHGFVEPHFTRQSAVSRMESLAEEEDRKMADKEEILYNLANIIYRNISIFSDEDKEEILIFLTELRLIDPKLYDIFIGVNNGA